MCRPHYARERQRIAQQNYDYKMRSCVTKGCLKKTSSETGYCAQHKRQIRVAGITWAKGERPNLGTCLVDKCETPTFNPGQICKLHRSRARMYSLTDEQIISMLHNAECAICARVDNLNIDHDHSCCPGEQSCGKCVPCRVGTAQIHSLLQGHGEVMSSRELAEALLALRGCALTDDGERMRQARATPVTAIQFGSELMRNWARESSDKFRAVLRWYFPKRFALMKEGKIR